MTQHSLHTLGASLQSIPIAMLFSKQLLLTQKSSVALKSDPGGGSIETYTVRATKMTAILKGIPGYNHGGLNE